MRSRICLVICLAACAGHARAASPIPAGTAIEILPPRNFPGWQSQNVCYPFVFQEGDGRYRMYYSGSGSEQWNDSNWDLWVSGSVTSTDTLTWKYPDNYEQTLFARRFMEGDLIDPAQTSAVFDSIHAIAVCIVKDGPTYRMWYTGWNGDTLHRGGGLTDKIDFRIGHATSNDGVRWTKVAGDAGAGSVLGLGTGSDYDSQGASCPCVLKEGSTYRMWYEGYDGTARRILHATSSDGVTWSKQGLALDKGGENAADELAAVAPLVIRRNSRYELWYQGQGRTAPAYRILRAVSDDGRTFSKLGEIALHPSPPVAGDERIHVHSAIVRPDGVQVFFAREKRVPKEVGYWRWNTLQQNYHTETLGYNRQFGIYTEVLNPNP